MVDGYPRGWVGVVEASTAEEAKRGAVEVFHGFCDSQEIEQPPRERMEVSTRIRYLDTGRAVRIVELINDRVWLKTLQIPVQVFRSGTPIKFGSVLIVVKLGVACEPTAYLQLAL